MCVSESVCHTKRVERSTDHNVPPIFTKLATKVESQEMWYCFGGNPRFSVRQTGSGINPHNLSWNISLMSTISNTVRDTMLDTNEVRRETTPADHKCDTAVTHAVYVVPPSVSTNGLSSLRLQWDGTISITDVAAR